MIIFQSESEVTQSCPTLCDPMDCSLPRSSVHGIFQARVLEWVAISFSRGSSRPMDRIQVSHIVGRRFISQSLRKCTVKPQWSITSGLMWEHACMHAKLLQSCLTLCSTRLLCSWNSPGKDTGVGWHALLQGIFPTQGLNPHLLHLQHGYY